MFLQRNQIVPHTITYTEEIEEHGYCQQRPELKTGDKYLLEVEGKMRLRIVLSVHFDKYVWEDVAQWTTIIEEYFEEEYKLCALPVGQTEVPVFVAGGMIGVLTCHKDSVCGELLLPSALGNFAVKGVARYGFYDCQNLTKVVFAPMVVIAYEFAFANSGLKEMAFNEEVAAMVHITALDGCDNMPKFDMIFDQPFPGLYQIRGGNIFRQWEEKLRQLHFLN